MHVFVVDEVDNNHDRIRPEDIIINGISFIDSGIINIDDLTGDIHDIIAPVVTAHTDKKIIGEIIFISSFIDINAGPMFGPHIVTNLNRIEYIEVNPILIRDRNTSGVLFCILIADSIIMSFE
jgi:hypothetical protein